MTSDVVKPRTNLYETFETMHRLLRREIAPGEAAARLGCPESRIALYPEFVLDHVRNILGKNFRVLASLLPSEAWEKIVMEYFRTTPPDHYEMNANAARFPEFLERMAGEGRFGIGRFHLELAEVEWLQWVVFSSPGRIPRPGAIRGFLVNPTLVVLELAFPVADCLTRWEQQDAMGFPQGVPAVPEEKDGGIVFIFRHPGTHEAVVKRATDPMLFAFKVAHENTPVDQAAEQARISRGEAESLLSSAVEAGFILL